MVGRVISEMPTVENAEWYDALNPDGLSTYPMYSKVRQYWSWTEECQKEFKAIVDSIAAADAVPVVFHCSAGKDRTGVVSALLLSVAGVSDEIIAADYAHTARNNATRIKEAGDLVGIPFDIDDHMEFQRQFCSPEIMLVFLYMMQTVHGGAEKFFSKIGVNSSTIDRLKSLLV
jgi:protein-tyrosine phosphatase